MKKKFTSLLLGMVTVAAFSFAFTACDKKGNDENASLSKRDYVQVLNCVATNCKAYIASANGTTNMSLTVSDSEFVECNNDSQAKGMFRASVSIVYFIRNILNREDYVLKTGYDDCFIEATFDHSYDLRFKIGYDEESSTIYAPLAVLQDNGTLVYYDFVIVYDFESETLTQFTLSGYSGSSTEISSDGVEYFRFKNNSLSKLPHDSSAFEDFATAKIAEMNAILKPEREKNPEDYSDEYNRAMQEGMGA